MRPIRLEFAGLQSYRAAQVVDFETLLGGGLFGIFGPTGSGKSTILDAITLALYGTVTRSEGSTKGILNHAENRLWVQFSFSLADALGERRYLVERNYKRQSSGAIATSGCRLVEVAGAVERVLADKDRELTARVVEILGLTEEDFTKAVVLPQGKFAEFMSMKDATRRQMLQRIFGLGQYGDRLQSRMKARTETVRRRLQEVTGRQVELGDASTEAMEQIAARLADAEQLLSAARSEAETVERDHKLWERVWNLQQELVLMQATLAAWEGDQAEADGRAKELAAAERAETLRHPLADERQGRDQAIRAARASDLAEREFIEAREVEEQERAKHRGAAERLAAEAPILSEAVVTLRQAVKLEGEIMELTTTVAKLAERVGLGRSKTAEVEAAILAAESQVVLVQERRDALLAEMTASAISPEHKERVGAAVSALQALQAAQQHQQDVARRLTLRLDESCRASVAAQTAQAEQQAAQNLLDLRRAALAEKQAASPADEESLRFEERWLSAAQAHARAVTDALGRLHLTTDALMQAEQEAIELTARLSKAETVEAFSRTALDRARTMRLAAQQIVDQFQLGAHAALLGDSLSPGDPCPVCGSTTHPQPATQLDQMGLVTAQEALRAADRGVVQAQSDLETTIRFLADAQAAVGASQNGITIASAEAQKAIAALESLRRDLPQSLQGVDPAALPDAIQQEQDRHATTAAALQQWRSEVDALRTLAETEAQAVARAALSLAGLVASQTAAAQGLREIQGDKAQADLVVAQRQAEFDHVRQDLDSAGLQAERQRIAAVEKRHGDLTRWLSEIGATQQAAERTLTAERLRHTDYRNRLQELETEHLTVTNQLDEKRTNLLTMAGDTPVRPQLVAAESRIRQLEMDQTTALTRREAAESRRSKAEIALATATAEHQIAQTRVAQTGAVLEAALARAGFADLLIAELALRTDAVRSQLSAWLRDREREGNRLKDSVTKVKQELAGRSLTPGDWKAQQERREQAMADLEQHRDDRTRAAKAHQDLLDKQSRWRELETERQGLHTMMGHLEELAKLLRGGAFVEYLASEQMRQVAQIASGRLGQLTGFRYGLELDEDGGFVIRDDGNGGVRRSVSTLSGGETFLTSLSLALALSASIQLRGHYPLEFFFLDEGFGTLDPELLTVVIDTLERLQFEKLNVGLISHVPEIRNRLSRRVIVTPADPGGQGSRLELEMA